MAKRPIKKIEALPIQAPSDTGLTDLFTLQVDKLKERLIQAALEINPDPAAAAELYHTDPLRFVLEAKRLGLVTKEENADSRNSNADGEPAFLDHRSEAAEHDDSGDPESVGGEDLD